MSNTDPSGRCVDADGDGRCDRTRDEPSPSTIHLPYVEIFCRDDAPQAFVSPIVHAQQGDDIGYFEGGSLTRGLGVVYSNGREKVFDLADFEYAAFTYTGWGGSTDVYAASSYFSFVTGWSNFETKAIENYSGDFLVGSAGVSVPLAKLFSASAVGFASPDGRMMGAALPIPYSISGTRVTYVLEGEVRGFRSNPNLPPTLEDAQNFATFAQETIDNPVLETIVVGEIYRVQREWQ